MSTLAAARADNFYISKNYDPSKVKVKKSDTAEQKPFVVVEGERVGGSKVRYETPFHVRCLKCENMVAKGVRFNSIKTWVDNFHSTKIYEFRMKCPQCIQQFVVRTDPQNCDYLYVSGAKRIFQTSDCTDETRIRDEEKQRKIKEDPFAKLENDYRDKLEYGNASEFIDNLQQTQLRGLQDFQLNRKLRKAARVMRQAEKEYFQQKKEKNLLMPLLKATQEDEDLALTHFPVDKCKLIKKEVLSDRERIKQKMAKLHPNIKRLLKQEIKASNKPTSYLSVKK